MEWRAEITVDDGANGIGRTAATLGIEHTQEFDLLGVRRDGHMLPPDTPIEADDVMIFQATEKGVKALWGAPVSAPRRSGSTPPRWRRASRAACGSWAARATSRSSRRAPPNPA